MTNEVKIKYLNKPMVDQKLIADSANRIINCSSINISESGEVSTQLFEDGSTLYFNPTESLKVKDFVNGRGAVATVLASGDFALDAAYHGAKDILTFDVNGFQFYPASLKLSALQNFNYEDYIDFLCDDIAIDKFLSEEMYIKLKKMSNGDEDMYHFFDVFFSEYSDTFNKVYFTLASNCYLNSMLRINPKIYSKQEYLKIIRTKLSDFFNLELSNDLGLCQIDKLLFFLLQDYTPSPIFDLVHGYEGRKEIGTYIENESSYNKVKDKISDVDFKFIRTNLLSLSDSLKKVEYFDDSFKGFQAIYLSNVPEYIDGVKFAAAVDKQLMPLLQDDGVIVYCCQGVTSKSLNVDSEKLERIKASAGIRVFSLLKNPMVELQYANDVEAYSLLKNKYRLETEEVETQSEANGLEKKDTFVYVKK